MFIIIIISLIIIMITAIDILFIFIFMYLMFCLQIPDIENDNDMLNKFIIFISLFCFYYALQIIKKIKGNCKINLNDITKNSLIVALTGSLGYSFYTDLVEMNFSKDYIKYFKDTSKYVLYLVIVICIILLITIIKIIELLLTSNQDPC